MALDTSDSHCKRIIYICTQRSTRTCGSRKDRQNLHMPFGEIHSKARPDQFDYTLPVTLPGYLKLPAVNLAF